MERDVVLDYLGSGIYSDDPRAGLRELYANEARACRAAGRLGARPSISVEYDALDRRLTIRGEDSMGMPRRTFEREFARLGDTTNADGSENGQFGMGHIAYTTLGDEMRFETRSREDGSAYQFISRKARTIEDGLPEPDIEGFGSAASVILRDSVDPGDLLGMARECARLSGVPTVWVVYNAAAAGGTLEDGEWPLEQGIDPEDAPGTITVAVQGGGLEAHAVFGGPREGVRGYLARLPISMELELPGLLGAASSLVIHAKDERRYRPMPDRGRLTRDAEVALGAELRRLVLPAAARRFAFGSFEEFRSSPHRRAVCAAWAELPRSGRGLIRGDIGRWQAALDTAVIRPDRSRATLWDAPRHREIVMASVLDARRSRAVGRGADAWLFRPCDAAGVDALAALGILQIEEYMEEHGIDAGRQERRRGITVHGACLRDLSRSRRRQDLRIRSCSMDGYDGEYVVRAKRLRPALGLLDRMIPRYMLAGEGAGVGRSEDEFNAMVSSKEYSTPEGSMTGSGILSRGRDILLVECDYPGFAGFEAGGFLQVSGTADELFEVGFLCVSGGRTVHVGTHIGRGDLCERPGDLARSHLVEDDSLGGIAGRYGERGHPLRAASCVRHAAYTIRDPRIGRMLEMAAKSADSWGEHYSAGYDELKKAADAALAVHYTQGPAA
ncbi:hypothetical protein CENSYa_0725 [Cenarchaeum symbiosum A]|uniref:Uncharacterized protein n=1 Tax=Cenarchaeum symbiosum (strain A) TaxID=414004 RepID=A0RVJ1_CENSY|nr:hypothetical protein CENSYa_0725 [Cenarchaeum symbiosum A]